MGSLQNVNSTVTVYIQAHCIRKPNSMTFWQRFKDFQVLENRQIVLTLSLFKNFQGLENLEKIQGLSRIGKSPESNFKDNW